MAALMIPGGKLTDRWGRKRCFMLGLTIYGVGAVLSAAAPGLGVLILGNSILEGVGTALLIPPVYILTTMLFGDVKARARAFGVISGLGGVGAAMGPLLGGLITSAISWRAAFVFQAIIIVIIVLLGRNIVDPVPPDPARPFDTVGAVLSALGLVTLVAGDPRRRQQRRSVTPADRHCSRGPRRVLRLGAQPGAGWEGGAAVDGPLPQPHLQPRPRHPERPVAHAHGHVVRRLRLPSSGARTTTPSRPASSSPRPPSASWRRPLPPAASPGGSRSGRSSWLAS